MLIDTLQNLAYLAWSVQMQCKADSEVGCNTKLRSWCLSLDGQLTVLGEAYDGIVRMHPRTCDDSYGSNI